MDFKIRRRDIELLADLVRACHEGARTQIYDLATDTTSEGVARRVFAADSAAFPDYITPDCRVLVTLTTGLDIFVPINRIEDVTLDGHGLWISVEGLA